MRDQENKSTKSARLTINLPADLVRKLKIEAIMRNATAGKIIEEILEKYFKSKGDEHVQSSDGEQHDEITLHQNSE